MRWAFSSIFLTTALLFANTSYALRSADLLEEYGSGNKAQLTTETPYRFMTWNIYKGGIDGLFEDYGYFVDNIDFVATQEFILSEPQEDMIKDQLDNYWAFAKSFESGDGWTGVATVSKWQAKTSMPVKSPGTEPFAGTPKMSLISLFTIEDGRELMIVNVHGLNFNLTHGAFKEQINDLVERIKNHVGPMILAGDFNTWADERLEHLLKKTKSLNLTHANLKNDMGIMNATLDHIFYREMTVTEEMVLDDVQTSDHLPMMIQFSL